MSDELDINVPNQLEHIPDALDEVDGFLETWSADGSTRFDFRIALEELLTNVISYGYEDDLSHKINVFLKIEGEDILCKLTDDGVAFDPLKRPTPDLDADVDERQIGGLGIHFVRETMNSVGYERRDGLNQLTLRRARVSPD